MARYIALIRFTESGAKNISQSPTRAKAFRDAAEKAGAKIEAQYWTVGACDGVLILSAADEKKALHCLTELAAAGNVRTETMQAFDSNEFAAIAAK
jgi:uncharacterized protein with GYD domain